VERPETDISGRERLILEAVVDAYIARGEPVGSRTVTQREDVSLSPATVRNVMADLEERGLLSQPHTSAGRVPTDRGFRVYVDQVVKLRDPTALEQDQLEGPLRRAQGPLEVMETCARQLSSLSGQACVVLAPRRAVTRFHHLDLVPLPDGRILVILVDQSGNVQNRVLEPEAGVALRTEGMPGLAARLNERCRGLTLDEARARIVEDMRQSRADLQVALAQVLGMAERVVEGAARAGRDVFLAGETRVLESPELVDVERMRGLLQTFEEKHLLVSLLERIQVAQAVQVFIGRENPREVAACSVVAASYGGAGGAAGVVGVIGPMRMDYGRVVPLVTCAAQRVSRYLGAR
jgi:heat-inducible transcriptional repressor